MSEPKTTVPNVTPTSDIPVPADVSTSGSTTTNKGVWVVLGVFGILLFILLIVVVYQMRTKTGIFAQYKAPPLENGWQPGGPVVDVPPDVIAQRAAAINSNVAAST